MAPTKAATGSKDKKPAAAAATGDKKEPASKLKPATAINVRHILTAKQSTSLSAIEALNAGKSFADVAREFSEDKARQGGALGWKVRGSLIKEFEDVAYGLEVSTVNAPKWGTVKTGEGYHVVMVEGRR